jgi:hypothetical protein
MSEAMNQELELLKETEWSRFYRVGSNGIRRESKFMTDHLEVNAEQLIRRWVKLPTSERHDFAQAFRGKRQLSADDERLLEFLMQEGDEIIWATIAVMLVRHRNRELVIKFLMERIVESPSPKANFYQAAELIGDLRFAEVLEKEFRKSSSRLGSTPRPNRGPSHEYLEFLRLCHVLWTITGRSDYKEKIESLSDHPSELVRKRVRMHLSQP